MPTVRPETTSISIVGMTTQLREDLTAVLGALGVDNIVSIASLSEIKPGQFPQSGRSLLIIECCEDSRRLVHQVAAVKNRSPLTRIALLGGCWIPFEIAAAFDAGASAYFAEARASEQFVRAIELILFQPQVEPPSIEIVDLPPEGPAANGPGG